MIAILNQDYDPEDDIKKNELLRRIYRNITGVLVQVDIHGLTSIYVRSHHLGLHHIIQPPPSSSVAFHSAPLRVEPAPGIPSSPFPARHHLPEGSPHMLSFSFPNRLVERRAY